MNEVQIGEQLYRIGKLSAMQQWHIARRILPIAMKMGGAISSVLTGEAEPTAAALGSAWDSFVPVAEAISGMSDADTEYVINTCLGVCFRKQSEQFAPVRSAAGLMFQDIDMRVMMQLTVAVIKEHRLADFMSALPAAPS